MHIKPKETPEEFKRGDNIEGVGWRGVSRGQRLPFKLRD